GNQLTQTGTTPITFSVSSSNNQLTATTGSLVRSYSYDAAGHVTGYGTNGFTYNNRGRIAATVASTTDYLYNALGQMIEKSGTLGTTVLMQDDSGHLIGEYNGSGQLIEETVWVGDIPVATLQPNGSGGVNIYYVHTDHLNSPKKIAQPTTGTLAWRWDTDPFGTAAPNQNPGGLGTFAYNLRFPGQYYQAETGLNQNVNRDYDPLIGKYDQSDPAGLSAGVNTYSYVLANPLWYSDPYGLLTEQQVIALINANNLSKLSTELILCLIYKESSFNPDAQNGAHRGLMQLFDSSAEWVGYSPTDMLDPALNIQAGTKLLNRLVIWKNLGNGDVADGLRRYGPTGETPPYQQQILNCEDCLKKKHANGCDQDADCFKALHGGK
ncbi:MAG TPA: RHS repeat-associated core domain-containing protein, partial [Steroidobacteraceae bacterium]|nr:RHS repeat-associated core domain-containing protein [Steroidobacteraceae bacterium]